MTQFKAISFDAAGTLLHAHPSVGHIYADVVSRYGPSVDAQTMDAAFRMAFREKRNTAGHPSEPVSRAQPPAPRPQSALQNEGYDWWRALVFDVLESLGIAVRNPDAFFRELYWRFAEVDAWRLFPDALPALLEARGRGLKIALVSNWDVRLRRLIEGMGIVTLFDAIVISTEVRAEKPDPRIFRAAWERLGIEPSELLHLGDHLHEDVEGARAAGLEALLIDRGLRRPLEAGTINNLRCWDVGRLFVGRHLAR